MRYAVSARTAASRRDRNIYCSDCGIKAATRDAAARYRQTKKYRETYKKWAEERQSRPVE